MFSVSSFRTCLFNPMEDDFWYSSEQLQAIGSEKAVKYVICLFDPGSPLRKEYTELAKRREVAAEIADFTDEDLKADLKPVILGYLRLVKSRLWATIIAIELTIWEMVDKLATPVQLVGAGQDKDRLAAVNMKPETAEKLIQLNEKLDALILKYCDNSDDLKPAVEEEVTIFKAESIANMIKRDR